MKQTQARVAHRQDGPVRYKHDLGQHFLYDTALLRSLVGMAGVQTTDRVLEIGPGAGTLTVCLCEAAQRVLAVEVDEAVIPFLRVATEGFGNVEILQGDIRKLNLRSIAAMLDNDFLVVANIPYNITTPILDLFWGSGLPVRRMAVMVQEEVAHKLIALPGDDAFCLTSLRCRYYCEPTVLAYVPAEAFTPPPKVNSAFVSMVFRSEPPTPVRNEALLWRMVKANFNQRRKTLLNALKGVEGVAPDALRAVLAAQGHSPSLRGEALSMEEWITLSNALADFA